MAIWTDVALRRGPKITAYLLVRYNFVFHAMLQLLIHQPAKDKSCIH